MFKISKNYHNIVSITIEFEYSSREIDNLFIIPGVTYYKYIYSVDNFLFLENENKIEVKFNTAADLEKFFLQLMRDIKIDKIINK